MNGIALLGLLFGAHNPASAHKINDQPIGDQTINRTIGLVSLVDQKPVTVVEVEPGIYLVDFGKVAFGNIVLQPPKGTAPNVTVHFGEAMDKGRINRKPPGTVRYAVSKVELNPGPPQVIAPAPDARNTEANSSAHPPAILTPKEWGVLLPFRWVEIEGWPGKLNAKNIKRQAAFDSTWDDNAASFKSSDPTLNHIWDLCQYSIKATTFAGIFVDGDRERIPYEADAYLNQLSYYATSASNQIPRATFDHLMTHGTWPTEWAYHMVFMAYADWMQTGDTEWLAKRYDSLKSKLLSNRVGADGLVQSSKRDIERTDIVDWPVGERDGYEFKPLNTVVNSFYVRSLRLMSIMGKAIGRDADATYYSDLESKVSTAFHWAFFDPQKGLYRDGAESDHNALHANLFPLAFDLVPAANRESVVNWLKNRGMKCSVYAAQYLLEGLFENDEATAAIDLILAPGDRSWRHMVNSGTTITWEAWDQKYKPNQDWNHAWGAAPANLLPRYVLGVRAQTPGWKQVAIKPNPGPLSFARGKVPTPLGSVWVDWNLKKTFTLALKLPKGMSARIELPHQENAREVL
ncbi:MAG TPA: alpha-L-rhamnosidase C-terminal domain-containing protein, partial [Fimbriimonas sp.]|nr:alpha-L-rhamnosidase C-terminal domain-containing protein [Fimbriimonas sp.]